MADIVVGFKTKNWLIDWTSQTFIPFSFLEDLVDYLYPFNSIFFFGNHFESFMHTPLILILESHYEGFWILWFLDRNLHFLRDFNFGCKILISIIFFFFLEVKFQMLLWFFDYFIFVGLTMDPLNKFNFQWFTSRL